MTPSVDPGRLLRGKKACLFDLFHTLTSVEEASPDTPRTPEVLGIDRTKWNEQLLQKSPLRLKGKLRDHYEIIRGMALAVDPGLPDETIRKAVRAREESFRNALVRMPASSTDTIRRLKARGVKTALVSNADVMEKAAWSLCPAAPHFDSVIFSCDVGYMKPEPEIYGLALKELGEPPEACVFIGDGGSDELRAAKSLGMATVLVYGYVEKLWPELLEGREKHADCKVRYVDELLL